jgi:hypothetical protein
MRNRLVTAVFPMLMVCVVTAASVSLGTRVRVRIGDG